MGINMVELMHAALTVLRTQTGDTSEQFAKKLGYTRQSFSNLEKCVKKFRLKKTTYYAILYILSHRISTNIVFINFQNNFTITQDMWRQLSKYIQDNRKFKRTKRNINKFTTDISLILRDAEIENKEAFIDAIVSTVGATDRKKSTSYNEVEVN